MPKTSKEHQVVLAHDSFTQLGGAERVVLALAEIFPNSPVYCLCADPKVLQKLPESVSSRIVASPLQLLFRIYPKLQHLLPFIPLAIKFTHIPSCQVLLSSSSAFAKAFRKPVGSVHIDYCHTPTRFLWSNQEYLKQEVPTIFLPLARIFTSYFRRWDLSATKQIDMFIANSQEVATRIRKYYNRESKVVYPYIDNDFWHDTGEPKEDYVLVAGRLQQHKDHETALRVCQELGLRVKVAGTGRNEARLKQLASPKVEFLGRVTDEQLRSLYSKAKALLYPQLEDFGLMPLEAAACGTPTVALGAGGSLETVVDGVTGIHFGSSTNRTFKEAIEQCLQTHWNVNELRAHAQKFSKAKFTEQILSLVNHCVQKSI